MESDIFVPTFDPGGVRELIVFYWGPHDDIVSIHINERRAALTVEVDGGIYLREVDGDIVGMEVHGFGRAFPRTPALSRVTIPAIAELEAFACRKLGETPDGGFEVRAAAKALPLTTQMLTFVIGHALATHEAELRAERAGVVHAYLAAS